MEGFRGVSCGAIKKPKDHILSIRKGFIEIPRRRLRSRRIHEKNLATRQMAMEIRS